MQNAPGGLTDATQEHFANVRLDLTQGRANCPLVQMGNFDACAQDGSTT